MTFVGKYNGDDEDLEADGEADEADEVDQFGALVGDEFFSPSDSRLRYETVDYIRVTIQVVPSVMFTSKQRLYFNKGEYRVIIQVVTYLLFT